MSRLLVLAAVALAVPFPSGASTSESRDVGPVYLVYAGPYSASPSSAFGHLFLTLADSSDEPPPLWDVVTFNAETFDADPFRYLTVGIKGGFLGRYSRVQFHEKTREYGVIADRDLWLVEIVLSASERSRLEQLLVEAEDDWLPYTFFSRNCAYYLQQLLAEVTGAVPLPSGVTSPTGVLHALQDSRVGGRAFFRPAASQRLLRISADLPTPTVGELRRHSWRQIAADTAWQNELNSFERRFVLEFLSLRLEETSLPLSVTERSGLASLRVSTAADVRGDNGLYPTEMQEQIGPPRFHEYSRLRVSQGTDEQQSARTYFQLRGALHDESDPWYGHRPITSLDFLSLEVSTSSRGFRPRLESAVFFSQRALSPGDWIRPRASWLLEMQARRGGVFSGDGVHFEFRGGSGGTWALPLRLHGYALLTTGIVGEWGAGIDFAPGVELGLLALAHPSARLGLRWTHERRITAWSEYYERLTAWGKVDLAADWGLIMQWRRAGAANSWIAGFDWYL